MHHLLKKKYHRADEIENMLLFQAHKKFKRNKLKKAAELLKLKKLLTALNIIDYVTIV